MSLKSKGINAERDLIKKFWKHKIPAVRVAGSGSSSFPCPDIVAGNRKKKLAIESKITKDNVKYFKKKEIDELLEYSNLFGAEPWLAVKFSKNDWLFIHANDANDTGKCYSIDIENAKRKGMVFEELIASF